VTDTTKLVHFHPCVDLWISYGEAIGRRPDSFNRGGEIMIRLIQGRDRHLFSHEIDQMHRLRKQVFHERLGWEVPVINEWEVDGYDTLDPLYVLSIAGDGRVVGGLRLLPTTGFNMLNDSFPELLPEGERFASPLIWESSRFTVDRGADARPRIRGGIGRATAELGLAMNELGMHVGLTHIVTVYDAFLHRILERSDCAGEPLSEPKMVGGVLTYAVLYEIGPELESRLRTASGITESVLPQQGLPRPLIAAE
jgi:acyl homoserine lactone synthase